MSLLLSAAADRLFRDFSLGFVYTQRQHTAFATFKMPPCGIIIVSKMAGVILGAVCFESPHSTTPHVELPATLVSVSSAHFHFLAVDGSGRLYR